MAKAEALIKGGEMKVVSFLLGALLSLNVCAEAITLPQEVLRETSVLAEMIRAEAISSELYWQRISEEGFENNLTVAIQPAGDEEDASDYTLDYLSTKTILCSLVVRVYATGVAKLQKNFRCSNR